jgi:hypothetical protein
MDIPKDSLELNDMVRTKTYEPKVEALQKREDRDREELVRLGKKPVLKVRSQHGYLSSSSSSPPPTPHPRL